MKIVILKRKPRWPFLGAKVNRVMAPKQATSSYVAQVARFGAIVNHVVVLLAETTIPPEQTLEELHYLFQRTPGRRGKRPPVMDPGSQGKTGRRFQRPKLTPSRRLHFHRYTDAPKGVQTHHRLILNLMPLPSEQLCEKSRGGPINLELSLRVRHQALSPFKHHGWLVRTRAFKITSNFRMAATRATLAGLPSLRLS